MKWALFKKLFWNTNDSVVNNFFHKQRFFLWDSNHQKLTTIKIRFSLFLEKILVFASNPNMAREVKDLSPNLKQNAWRYFTLLNILIWMVRSIFSLNFK